MKSILKVIPLLLIVILFNNCHVEEDFLEQNNRDALVDEISERDNKPKTVTVEEAINFVQNIMDAAAFSKSDNDFMLFPFFDMITQEPLSNTDALLTVIPIVPIEKAFQSSRITLIKINNQIMPRIVSMTFNTAKEGEKYTGKMFLNEIDGRLSHGFVMENGFKVAKLVKRKKTEEKLNEK